MHTANRRFLLMMAVLTVALSGCSTAGKNKPPPPAPAPVAAPAPIAVPAPPPPAPMAMVPAPSYVIEDVNFDINKSNLKPAATDTLDRVADALRDQPDVHYEVAGFTDSAGSAAYNQALSERRAEMVRAYLVGQGVDGGLLSTRGYGESQPVTGNDTKEGRAKNRRVEVRPRK